jgi:hypothetical protein
VRPRRHWALLCGPSTSPLGGMRVLALSLLAGGLVSCAVTPRDHNELCDELARFGNVEAVNPRTVRLTTDWSLRPDPDNPGGFIWGTKTCTHENIQAGRNLCSYLLENTSTEFAELNYKRALRCIGTYVSTDPASRQQLPGQVKSRKVLGARVNGELTIAFSPGQGQQLPVLEISAKQAR